MNTSLFHPRLTSLSLSLFSHNSHLHLLPLFIIPQGNIVLGTCVAFAIVLTHTHTHTFFVTLSPFPLTLSCEKFALKLKGLRVWRHALDYICGFSALLNIEDGKGSRHWWRYARPPHAKIKWKLIYGQNFPSCLSLSLEIFDCINNVYIYKTRAIKVFPLILAFYSTSNVSALAQCNNGKHFPFCLPFHLQFVWFRDKSIQCEN